MKTFLTSIAVLSIFAFTGCNRGKAVIDETTTRGNIKVSVDEGYKILAQAESEVFMQLYKYAKINISYKPESDVIADLMNDSVRCVMVSRKLTENEENILKKNLIIPKTTKIALDAVAFIVNESNSDTLIRYNQIESILKGDLKEWSQINNKSGLQGINVVFDNKKSGNVRMMMERFNLSTLPENCFAVNSNEEVINYVKKNHNSLGIISVNWISDPNDTLSGAFLKMVKVVYIGSVSNTDGTGDFYPPLPGNIVEGSYPFVRETYMINRETFTGLGSGFIQFVAGDKGQRIVRRAGMIPAQIPIRLIKIKE